MKSSRKTLDVNIYRTYEEMCQGICEKILAMSEKVIHAKGQFNIALSGSVTPKGIYLQMSSPDYRKKFQWHNIHFFWGDERLVPTQDIRSNYRMVAEALLARVDVDVPIENIHPIRLKHDPEASAAAYEQELMRFFHLHEGEFPRFDLIILGVGEDGHVASLFPESEALSEANRLAIPTMMPDTDLHRVSLTLPVINNAEQIFFVVSGNQKAAVVSSVLDNREDLSLLPAQKIQPKHGNVTWFLDKGSSSLLDSRWFK